MLLQACTLPCAKISRQIYQGYHDRVVLVEQVAKLLRPPSGFVIRLFHHLHILIHDNPRMDLIRDFDN